MNLRPLCSVACALALSLGVAAHSQTMTKQELQDAQDSAEKDYSAAKAVCDTLTGRARKICTVEAEGNKKSRATELVARNRPSAQAQRQVRDTRAQAAYELAEQKCQESPGNARDICIAKAKSIETTENADAKLQLKTSEANAEANQAAAQIANEALEKVGQARSEAVADKLDAQYKVETENCASLDGEAKITCMAQAKARTGK